ncbi:hypothetical protein BGZ97_010173, partial [Linnemannia gamsii]
KTPRPALCASKKPSSNSPPAPMSKRPLVRSRPPMPPVSAHPLMVPGSTPAPVPTSAALPSLPSRARMAITSRLLDWLAVLTVRLPSPLSLL